MPSQYLPRVTDILEALGVGPDYDGAPLAALEAGRIRGRAVHDHIEGLVYGVAVDDELLSDDVLARVNAYRAFVKDSGYQTTHTEIEVRHPTWKFRGHPDSVGWLDSSRVLVDWKCMDSVQLAPSALQLAAYALAWNAHHTSQPIGRALVVQLKSDASYRVHEITDLRVHEQTWLAALTLYHYKRERGLLR